VSASGERAGCLRRVMLGRGLLRGLRLRGDLHHQGCPVVRDQPSGAGSRFELRQLRHGGNDPVLAPRGKALRLRRSGLEHKPKRSIVPVRSPCTSPDRSSLSLIHPSAHKGNSANFVLTAFSEVELPLSGFLGSPQRPYRRLDLPALSYRPSSERLGAP
jgi:hypothetical protein